MTAEDRHAFGHPGIPPRWTSSLKDGVGTAYNTASRVWFTISHGILNEVYYPTIDRPQIRDLQFLISDGATFFHEEKRHLVHEIEYIERNALGYHIVSADREGRYRIVKEIIAIEVADQGEELDPAKLPDYCAEGGLLQFSGRGLFLMRALMDAVEFSVRPGGGVGCVHE